MDNDLKRPKPVVLAILDGWGVKADYVGNAITQARTPFFDSLVKKYPSAVLNAYGQAVGLPVNTVGNSEIGHLVIGAGRPVEQELLKIDRVFQDKSILKNSVLATAIQQVKKNKGGLHLVGLISESEKHSSLSHLFGLIKIAKRRNVEKIFVHVILDGLDTSPTIGVESLEKLINFLAQEKIGKIATISGRFYAMDRDNHWERTAKVYTAMTQGEGREAVDPLTAIRESYSKKIFDHEIVPTVIKGNDGQALGQVMSGDALIFFNFLPERIKQLVEIFTAENRESERGGEAIKKLYLASFANLDTSAGVQNVFAKDSVSETLAEIISRAGLTQMHIAETEKFSHVTYFFNGEKEMTLDGETDRLIPARLVDDELEHPKMSALALTKAVVKAIEKNEFDFIVLNLANLDIIGHLGDLQKAKKSAEVIDGCLRKIFSAVNAKDGVLVVTSDHGNAESMLNLQTEEIEKNHTANPVPFILVGKDFEGKNIGWPEAPEGDLALLQPIGTLADIAPTILKIMGLEKPSKMTGKELF